ncbi:hypothetical protein GQ55_7G072100 [Panicum hallii var. hallii]|uniref:Uncharacterized protein n=1 Tax=Panicum hallii var. hallii TaxID=1504633 RepID=A0A2T7CST6_9POAL|nr:hypothetical protein GQ55_7G072100 [Panicum hallii var. hallii]
MALLVRMGTGVLLFAALVAAMVHTAMHAFMLVCCLPPFLYDALPCCPVVPCNATTCFEYCQKNNYKNVQTYCTPGQYYPICCCRMRGAAAGP